MISRGDSMKKLKYYSDFGNTFFFIDDNVVWNIDESDMLFRSQFIRGLFELIQVSLELIEKMTPKQKKSLKQYCKEWNIEET